MQARLRRWLLILSIGFVPAVNWAAKQTVCTITINSADEQKTFRRFLPPDKYEFVELVERGRPDWLASSCQQKVSCDILIISGHHGEGSEGNVFFSESNDAREYLPIEELERVSCSNSCPSLFEHLKEVYLFGCNTLNPLPQHTVSGEVARSLQREGHPPAEAARLARDIAAQRGESGRDRMQLVFPNVPVIYGFSSVAPLGPSAASKLDRVFHRGAASQVGTGRVSAPLLREFAGNRMVATRGMSADGPLAAMRRDVCMFADDRATAAQRLAGIHQLLDRPTAEARMVLERIEAVTATLDAPTRSQPDVAAALAGIAGDRGARERFLAFARDADELDTRARMLKLARDFDWLTPQQHADELVRMVGELLARKEVRATDVNLACALDEHHELDGAAARLGAMAARDDAGHAAVLACMGSDEARGRVLKALASPSDSDVQVAQAYLRHRPVADGTELRELTREIAAMPASPAQARALDALAHLYVSDPQSIATLKELFATTPSWQVQNAIASVLIRADRGAVRDPDLLPTLREHRLQKAPGDNMVNALIDRLQESS